MWVYILKGNNIKTGIQNHNLHYFSEISSLLNNQDFPAQKQPSNISTYFN